MFHNVPLQCLVVVRVVGVVGRTESSVVDPEEGPGGDEAYLP